MHSGVRSTKASEILFAKVHKIVPGPQTMEKSMS
jgi:hypothetical protein